MVNVRIESKPAFRVRGRKTWVGQDNELFGQFWEQCKQEGLTDLFRSRHADLAQTVTGSHSIGVSCVEKDPADRTFWFYVATEGDNIPEGWDLETYTVPAATWAIFENYGETPEALIAAEMYAFGEWLPQSPYAHAHAPEIEAYPPRTINHLNCYEFWLPIEEKAI
jgi:AraC family transcriptional regulator